MWRYNTSTTGDHDVGAGACITAPGVNGFADGEVYIDGKDQVLYALDLMTGTLSWSFNMQAAIGVKVSNSVSTPACVGSSVYVGFGYGVWAFDAATGAEHWYSGTSHPVSGVVLSSPAIAGSAGDQVIYSNDGGGAITAYRLTDGATLWSYLTSMPMYGSAAVSDGQVFFGGLDGNVYAFGPATGAISGTVTDAGTQTPIDGATVSCTCSVSSVTTDMSGDYSFTGVAVASDYSLSFSATGYAPQTFNNVSVAAGTTTTENAQLALGLGGEISGQVTDATATGNPALPGVTVECTCQGGSATTDSLGSYSFTGLPAGSYSMTFAAAGFVPDQVDNVSVSAGGTTTINAALTEDGAISGTVTDAKTGNPDRRRDRWLHLPGASTLTNSTGSVCLHGCGPGRLRRFGERVRLRACVEQRRGRQRRRSDHAELRTDRQRPHGDLRRRVRERQLLGLDHRQGPRHREHPGSFRFVCGSCQHHPWWRLRAQDSALDVYGRLRTGVVRRQQRLILTRCCRPRGLARCSASGSL